MVELKECCLRRHQAISRMLKWYYKDERRNIYGPVSSFKLVYYLYANYFEEETPFTYSEDETYRHDRFQDLVKLLRMLEGDFLEHCKEMFNCSHYMDVLLSSGEDEVDPEIRLLEVARSDRDAQHQQSHIVPPEPHDSHYSPAHRSDETQSAAGEDGYNYGEQSYRNYGTKGLGHTGNEQVAHTDHHDENWFPSGRLADYRASFRDDFAISLPPDSMTSMLPELDYTLDKNMAADIEKQAKVPLYDREVGKEDSRSLFAGFSQPGFSHIYNGGPRSQYGNSDTEADVTHTGGNYISQKLPQNKHETGEPDLVPLPPINIRPPLIMGRDSEPERVDSNRGIPLAFSERLDDSGYMKWTTASSDPGGHQPFEGFQQHSFGIEHKGHFDQKGAITPNDMLVTGTNTAADMRTELLGGYPKSTREKPLMTQSYGGQAMYNHAFPRHNAASSKRGNVEAGSGTKMSAVMQAQQMLIKKRMQSNLREAQAHLARIPTRKVSHVISQSQSPFMTYRDHGNQEGRVNL